MGWMDGCWQEDTGYSCCSEPYSRSARCCGHSSARSVRRSGLVAVCPDRGSVGAGRRNVRICLCVRDRGQALLCNRAGRAAYAAFEKSSPERQPSPPALHFSVLPARPHLGHAGAAAPSSPLARRPLAAACAPVACVFREVRGLVRWYGGASAAASHRLHWPTYLAGELVSASCGTASVCSRASRGVCRGRASGFSGVGKDTCRRARCSVSLERADDSRRSACAPVCW